MPMSVDDVAMFWSDVASEIKTYFEVIGRPRANPTSGSCLITGHIIALGPTKPSEARTMIAIDYSTARSFVNAEGPNKLGHLKPFLSLNTTTVAWTQHIEEVLTVADKADCARHSAPQITPPRLVIASTMRVGIS
jgi:hypothetical protein